MLGVLVGVGAVDLEASVLPTLADLPDVHVVRRCVDVPDLVSVAVSGQAHVALVALSLRGLDADAVERLVGADVTVVGLCDAADEGDRATLRRLGVPTVLTPEELTALPEVARATRPAGPDPHAPGHRAEGAEGSAPTPAAQASRPGQVVAVWGPTGAPGRSTVALGLAAAAARLQVPTVAVDADVYGGSLAQLLGLLDESSGLLSATRAANVGALDAEVLARHARQVGDHLRVLTGLPRADRWTEVRPVLVRSVLDTCRTLAELTVVDCGFSLELIDEVGYDTGAPRRNAATLEALSRADTVVVVGAADPVGLGRLIRGLEELAQALPAVAPYVVVNRVRSSLGWSREEITETVRRATGTTVRATVPDDPVTADRALVSGRSAAECAPGSRLSTALGAVAAELLGRPAAGRSGRLSWRRAARAR